MSALLTVGYFIFALFFSLLSFVLWTGIAIRYFKISSLHHVSQGVYALTNPIVTPLTHLFKTYKINLNRYDWPCFCVLVVVELFKFIAIGALFLGAMLPLSLLLLYTLASLIIQPCNILFYAIIIRIVMSWVNPNWNHPIAYIVHLVTEPIIRKTQQLIPNIYGFDFSAFFILIGLEVITIFIKGSLPLNIL